MKKNELVKNKPMTKFLTKTKDFITTKGAKAIVGIATVLSLAMCYMNVGLVEVWADGNETDEKVKTGTATVSGMSGTIVEMMSTVFKWVGVGIIVGGVVTAAFAIKEIASAESEEGPAQAKGKKLIVGAVVMIAVGIAFATDALRSLFENISTVMTSVG